MKPSDEDSPEPSVPAEEGNTEGERIAKAVSIAQAWPPVC